MRLDRVLAQPFQALPGHREWPPRAFVFSTTMPRRIEPTQGGHIMRRRLPYGTQGLAILTALLVVLAIAGPAAAQGKPIRIG